MWWIEIRVAFSFLHPPAAYPAACRDAARPGHQWPVFSPLRNRRDSRGRDSPEPTPPGRLAEWAIIQDLGELRKVK